MEHFQILINQIYYDKLVMLSKRCKVQPNFLVEKLIQAAETRVNNMDKLFPLDKNKKLNDKSVTG